MIIGNGRLGCSCCSARQSARARSTAAPRIFINMLVWNLVLVLAVAVLW